MLELVFPTRCAICDVPGAALCPDCAGRLRAPGGLVAPPGLATCRALVRYEDAGRALVVALKYRNRRAVVRGLAVALAELVPEADGLTWAPTSARRRRRRGFDQAEVLARAVAAERGLPCRRLLRRARGGPQTGRRLAERRRGPSFVPAAPSWPRVVVVDDVVTSGATLAAAASALRRAGAQDVHGVVLAATP